MSERRPYMFRAERQDGEYPWFAGCGESDLTILLLRSEGNPGCRLLARKALGKRLRLGGEHRLKFRTTATSGTLLARDPVELGASDDAALMIDRVQQNGGQGTYIAVGGGPYRPHHSPEFDIDESTLAPTVELLVRTILDLSAEPAR